MYSTFVFNMYLLVNRSTDKKVKFRSHKQKLIILSVLDYLYNPFHSQPFY